MEHQPISEFKSKAGFKRVIAALANSIEGFRDAWRYEHAFRQEVVLASIGTIVAVLLPVPAVHKAFLVSVLILVLMVEIINSAIEAVVDRIGLERHPLSKRAKDLGSAAVTLSLVIAALAWVSVLWNHFVNIAV